MNYLLLFLGLAQAARIPVAEPILPRASSSKEKGGFSLQAFPKIQDKNVSPFERIDAEYEYISKRYGVNKSRRSGPGETNPAIPVNGNAAYQISLNIGGQVVNLDPITGASVFWVPSAQVAGGKASPYSWNPAASTTSFSVANSNWALNYATASQDVSGQVYGDNIYWNSDSTRTDHNAGVWLATQSGAVRTGGVLGLDHALTVSYTVNGATQSQPTFFQHLIPTLPQPVFTVDFKNAQNGSIDFGYIDSSKFVNSITYYVANPPTAGNTTWSSIMTGYQVSGGASDSNRKIPFFVDTGTSLMYNPSDITANYWATVPGSFVGSYGYMFPCSASLPDFLVGKTLTPGAYFNYFNLGNGTCIGGMQKTYLTNGEAIWGDVWIKSVFLVFGNATASNPNSYIGVAVKGLTS